MRRSVIFLGIWLSVGIVFAQKTKDKTHLTVDYQLIVDNDVFALDLSQDQYYTSGIYPTVRVLKDSIGSTKVIRSYQLNHVIYTASDVRWRRITSMDRPYAGLLYLSASNEYYFKTQQYLKAELDLGWMGPASGVGQTQITYHGWFDMPTPRGWKFQINNSPVVNVDLTYLKAFLSNSKLEISTETNASFGTIYNYVRQNVIFRFGEKLKPLQESALTSSGLGVRRNKQPSKFTEFYWYYSPGFEYVIYNATIEGNLIGEKSVLTMDALKTVWQHRAGFMLSWNRFDWGIIAYWRTHENERAMNHNWVGIRLNQRF